MVKYGVTLIMHPVIAPITPMSKIVLEGAAL